MGGTTLQVAEGRDSGGSLQKDLQEDGTMKLLTLTEESLRLLKAFNTAT